ncbi:MAG: HK97 gp10 family phage protein [Bacteroidales bacterium]|nr:HK97 gp10 family phage protein [Bacteroidales bacterium]
MAETVTVDQLADAITEAVQAYTDDVVEAIEEETERTSEMVLEEVKNLAPKRTGDYAKSFTKTKRRLSSGVVYNVWNRKHYRRVHLLEFGHAKAGGGRVEGRPHMAPAIDRHAPGYEQRIKRIIERGG